jgi:V/A-type H+/Na+-transporting ATPase subunit E
MSLENVTDEIKSHAASKAAKIVADARLKADDIMRKANEEVNEYKKQGSSSTAVLIESMERKIRALAHQNAQRMIMNTKKELLQTVVANAMTRIGTLPTKEKEQFLTTLLTAAKNEIDVHTVYVNVADKTLIKGVKNLKTAEIAGGLLAEDRSGEVSVNLSVEELLESARGDLLVNVSEVLFS